MSLTGPKIIIVTFIFVLSASRAAASGYEIEETSVRGLGQAMAGAATGLGDGSGVYLNPGAVGLLDKTTITIGGVGLISSASLSNRGSRLQTTGEPVIGADGGDAGGDVLFGPAVYSVVPITETINAGLGFNAPFRVKSNFSENFVGRYQSIDTEFRTLNITPAVSIKPFQWISVGANLSIMRFDSKFSQALDFGTIAGNMFDERTAAEMGLRAQTADGRLSADGDDWGVGYGVGIVVAPTEDIKAGVSYRSKVEFDPSGDAQFTVPSQAAFITADGRFTDTVFESSITLPEKITAGASMVVAEGATVYLDASWTNWSRFEEQRLNFASNQPDLVLNHDWDDSWRIATGVALESTEYTIVRFGLAYDKSPIPSSFNRFPSIPGGDRYTIALGMSYLVGEIFVVDLGYAHLFISDESSNVVSDSGAELTGKWDLSADVAGASLTAKF